MALNSGPYSLTLNTAQLVPNPTASSNVAATKAQIQNASPFTLEIQTNGQQIIIQQFTAQTITLDGSGSPLTALPIAGPAGTQGGLTVVWLNPGQSPDMADGQLTGAAAYSVGLGEQVVGETLPSFNGTQTINGIAIPPTTRTMIFRILPSVGRVGTVTVTGATTGFVYYNQVPYLTGPTLGGIALCVVNVNGLIDPTVNLSILPNVSAAFPWSLEVWADTLLWPESDLYSGILQSVSITAAGSGTLLNGPFRLLAISIDCTNGSTGLLNFTWNSTGQILRVDTPAGASGNLSKSYPPNTIVPWALPGNLGAACELQCTIVAPGGTFAGISVDYAYP
jgi:hypothetical protein